MKALTLWQPWASLVALGVKTIETRSWSTTYRGPLAIHAAKRVVYGPVGPCYAETLFSDVRHVEDCYCDTGEVDVPCQRGATRSPLLTQGGQATSELPVGAVVATCTLVDVVPVAELGWTEIWKGWGFQWNGGLTRDDPLRILPTIVNVDERPYGDYSPGRFAWLLDDVEALATPIPAAGGQRLWNFREDL